MADSVKQRVDKIHRTDESTKMTESDWTFFCAVIFGRRFRSRSDALIGLVTSGRSAYKDGATLACFLVRTSTYCRATRENFASLQISLHINFTLTERKIWKRRSD